MDPSTIKTASYKPNDDDMEEEIPDDDDYADDFEDKPNSKAQTVEPVAAPPVESDRDRINRIMQERAAKLGGGSIVQPKKEEPQEKKQYPWKQTSN